MAKVGERVMAASHSDGNKLFVFGSGVYVGDEVPPKEAKGFNFGIPNPRIDLDNGETVFGCECWWGDEEKAKERFKGFEIIEVSIKKSREECEASARK